MCSCILQDIDSGRADSIRKNHTNKTHLLPIPIVRATYCKRIKKWSIVPAQLFHEASNKTPSVSGSAEGLWPRGGGKARN